MLTYLCRINKRLDHLVHLLREINQKHDEVINRLDIIDKRIKQLEKDGES
ncbi:MAG: hypothetical protein U9N81_02240 [Bacillota bacterium]|nr:hypothetical protein [Bacillota bacterium]